MPVERWLELLPFLAVGADRLVAIVCALHAVLYKRDPRAAVSWVGVVLLVPLLGWGLYVCFGINRIHRRAASLRRRRKRIECLSPATVCTPEELGGLLGPEGAHLVSLARVGESVAGRPLLEGNEVRPLRNGEEAYPAMIEAIDRAERTVTLLAYIFEKDEVGNRFIEALGRAAARGVEVRVLIDGLGGGSTLGASERAFAALKVPMARFLPLRTPFRTRYMNLRNHRKILVADGRVGFTGGMNLRASHLAARKAGHVEQDVHFRLEGPVVEHLQEAFVDDWAFTTGELLLGAKWFPRPETRGRVAARGVGFDPGETRDTLRWILVAAIGAARRSVRIVTPYFLPDPALIAALNVAALRGVEVDVLIPSRNDSRVVQWATEAMLWQVLSGGCRVWRTAPPFEHTKLMVVDGAWSFVGSANVDPRSLRLNFEFNVECFDPGLAARIEGIVEEKRRGAQPVTLRQVDARPVGVRLRDGLARLLTPYL
jgi:cardiolipin synthase